MKDLSVYEQLGIVIPGAGLLLGVLVLEPAIQPLFLGNGLSVGGLGLFIIIAYALGHIVAAAGNVIDSLIWACLGGMPSQWARKPKNPIVSESQRAAICRKANSRHGIAVATDVVVPASAWKHCFHVIYRDVMRNAPSTRIDGFNGSYGLNRGLAASCLLLLPLLWHKAPADWEWWAAGLIAMSATYAFRMCRFGVHFAREVLIGFSLLPDPPGVPASAKEA